MPAVDINTPTNTGGKQGFGTGLPTPVLLMAIGGGIGLVVFLSRKSGSNTGTGADKGTLLPNTAIMLGSLQQGILQLQGDVTSGNADLSSQLTGVGENLGTQIDMQSAQIQQSFADLNTYLGQNFQSIQGSETSLSQAVAGLGTQNADLANSLTKVLGNLATLQSNVYTWGAANQAKTDAGLASLGQSITGISGQIQQNQAGLVSVMNGVQALQNGQNVDQAQLAGLSANLNNIYNWETMINARVIGISQKTGSGNLGQGGQTGVNAWPGGNVPSWFNPPS